MAWIKRNLFFVLGSLVALALMVVGVFILLSQISNEQRLADQIAEQYSTLDQLNHQTPHPGVPGGIDNVKAAQEQTAGVRAYLAKVRKVFQRIPPVPDFTAKHISNSEFASELRLTVAQLRHSAEQQSVVLPPDYYFSFVAQSKIMNFDPASLDSMATHLGDVKVLCGLLFDAKVNYLEGIRREVVSLNDNNDPDYLPATEKTITTPLADITPYQATFRCFSGDLANVLANLANSPYGFVVKTINIEPVASAVAMTGDAAAAAAQAEALAASQRMAMYNNERRGGRIPGGGGYPQQPMQQPGMVAPRGPQTFLSEKPVRVTLAIQVVKLKPGAK